MDQRFFKSSLPNCPNSVFLLLPFGDTQSPLHLATYLNLSAVVKGLVGKGASLELQDQDGNTALHVACQHGQTDCASEMVTDMSPALLALVLETQNWRGEEGRETGSV